MVFSLTSLTPRPPVWQKTKLFTDFFSAPFPKMSGLDLISLIILSRKSPGGNNNCNTEREAIDETNRRERRKKGNNQTENSFLLL